MVASSPDESVVQLLSGAGFYKETTGWEEEVDETMRNREPRHTPSMESGLFRFYMGVCMAPLRGRVPAEEVGKRVRHNLEPLLHKRSH